MKKILLALILSITYTQSAHAVRTLTLTFNPKLTHWSLSCSSPRQSNCPRETCANYPPNAAPDECYDRGQLEALDQNQFQAENQALQKYYNDRIASLEEQLRSYQDKLSDSHRSIAEALMANPAFQKAIKRKISVEKK